MKEIEAKVEAKRTIPEPRREGETGEEYEVRRSLYWMVQDMDANERLFLYTFINRFFYNSKWENRLPSYHNTLVDFALDGLEECEDNSLIDLVNKLFIKSKEAAI